MINDLKTCLPDVKYVDDTTLYEIVHRNASSRMDQTVQEAIDWAQSNNMKLNAEKTKEMVISFSHGSIDPTHMGDSVIQRETCVKLLGLSISSDLTWSVHIDSIVKKASQRLFFLIQLRRAGAPTNDLLVVYFAAIRSILEYSCQVFHNRLTKDQCYYVERIQRRAFRIILPNVS